MKGDQHWPARADHEHVHCHHCGANAVHVEPPNDPDLRAQGYVVYGPHTVKGGTDAKCMKSRTMIVPDQHRHQGDPL